MYKIVHLCLATLNSCIDKNHSCHFQNNNLRSFKLSRQDIKNETKHIAAPTFYLKIPKIPIKLFDPLTSTLPSKLCPDINQKKFLILHFLKTQFDTIFHKSSIVFIFKFPSFSCQKVFHFFSLSMPRSSYVQSWKSI